ncbi:MAG TPA: Hsp20/alpha crystallin family protein [Pseudonocardiaceae bacterium]|jgi:HSP20 family protein|nr:Hsp20/alpha crystallin family protein [Pseudonocardiaceae bacterium]
MAIALRGYTRVPFPTLFRQFSTELADFEPRRGFVPAVDVTRDGADVLVTLELPGVDVEKDVDVEVADGRLAISGRRSAERDSDENGVLVREIRAGQFRREFALPKGVTAEHVTADYDRGLLKVRVREVAAPAIQPTKVKVRAIGSGESAGEAGDGIAAGEAETTD